jgi:hypothetical protein
MSGKRTNQELAGLGSGVVKYLETTNCDTEVI